MTPLPGFSAPPQIPNNNTSERPPVTTTVFAATTLENTPFAYHASTLTNPNPTISPASVEVNYEILESLLRDRRRQIRNEDIRTELEYFSEDYDEEREMEPRPEPRREATPTLWLRSPVVRRKRERVVGFEDAPNMEGNKRGKNAERIKHSEIKAREGENRAANLPPHLAAHLGWNESSQPLRSSLTSVQGGHQPLTNMGRNPLLTVNPYSQPSASLVNGQALKQRISGFVHGLKTRILVEHLSTDLPSTYKYLIEKTYTWVEAREVVTNGVSNNQRDDSEGSKKFSWGNSIGQKDRGRFSPYKGQHHKLLSNLVKSPREILAIEKVAKTFEQPLQLAGSHWSKDKTRYCHFHEDYGHETNQCRELKHQTKEAVKSGKLAHLVKGVKEKKEKTTGTRSEERKKEEKKPTLYKVFVLMISEKSHNIKKSPANHDGIGKITFPPLSNVGSSDPVIIKVYISWRQVNKTYLDGGSSCEVIYEHCFLKLKSLIRSLRVDSNTPLVGFSGEQSWPLGEIPLEVTIG
ncbi:hypothetical protein Tco_0071663 [Tanacetum coccineum]